jgi:tetratricopeptide (TPR) repeat protein
LLAVTLPPVPAVEPLLEQATQLREKGDLEGALGVYDSLVALATQSKEWESVVAYRVKRAEVLEDDDERASELCRAADILEEHVGDTTRAIAMLEHARHARPSHVGILLKLRQLYEAEHEWGQAIDVLDGLVRTSSRAREKGTYRFGQADLLLHKLGDEPRCIAFLELALDEDPELDRALSLLISIRTRREEWAELASMYERLLDRLLGASDKERAWEISKKLGMLRRDVLRDGLGAVEALRTAIDLHPGDIESRAALADLYANQGDRALAVRQLETVAVVAPLRADTYQCLYDLHARAQRSDRAWLAATCLEELAVADVTHEVVIEHFRPKGPICPTVAMNETWWNEALCAPSANSTIGDLLRAVSATAIAIAIEEREARFGFGKGDVGAKENNAKIDLAVRTFEWAARVLSVPHPALILLPNVPSGVAVLPTPRPAVALAADLHARCTVKQIAFLAGRQLTYCRPEHYALNFFPTLPMLSSLLMAAIRLIVPKLPAAAHEPPHQEGGSRIVTELGARLPAENKAALEQAILRLEARGGKLDLLSWVRHVELTAGRAGLLLAGDLRTALRIIKSERRTVSDLSLDAKRGDLLSFTVSEAYGKLRESMGVAILPSSPLPSLPASRRT